MTIEETRKLEKQIIHLMLLSREAVCAVAESPNQISHFDASHQPLIEALFEAESKSTSLTVLSYKAFLEARHYDKKIQIALNLLFQECRSSIICVKTDDLPTLLAQKRVSYVEERTFSLLEEFTKNKQKDVVFAAKELVDRLGSTLRESEDNSRVTFNDILSPEFWEQWEKELRHKTEVDNPITDCGIPEFDQVMGVGFDPETLTVICGDVGGYKCLRASTVLQLGDGGLATVEEVFNDFQFGKSVSLWSLDETSGRLFSQPIQAVYDNGLRETYRITTKSGRTLTATANHRHKVFGGYKRVDEITVGTHLAVARTRPSGTMRPTPSVPTWLGCMLSDGGCRSGCYTFTNFDASIVRAFKNACHTLNTPICVVTKRNIVERGSHRIRQCRSLGSHYGIDGKLSIEKSIHPEIFRWELSAIKDLLRAMYGCDGSFQMARHAAKDGTLKSRWSAQYHTSSFQLAKDVQLLLQKFGLIASIYEFESKCGDHRRQAYRVMLRDAQQVARFVREIGYLGKKQNIAESYLAEMDVIAPNSNSDLIPSSVWKLIDAKLLEQGKTHGGCRRAMVRSDGKTGRHFKGSCGTRGKSINRFLLRKIVNYLNNDTELSRLCDEDVFWDEVVSIKAVGVERVFDISMPTVHNFVADGFVTHNSTTMLNVALNTWKRHKKDVLFVGLEMPRNRLMDKIMSRECRIPFNFFQKPKNVFTDEHWAKIASTKQKLSGETGEGKFVLLEFGERTSVSAIRKQIEKHLSHFKPCVVVIDYIANLEPESGQRRRDRNDLEIGDMLKSLLKMGKPGSVSPQGFGIVTGAQLNRDCLKRMKTYRGDTTKFSFSSDDIQGSHQYSADATSIFCLYPDPANKNRIFIFPVKNRYGQKNYPDGSNKAAVEVQPEFNFMRSPNDAVWKSSADDDILLKVVSPPKIDDHWEDMDDMSTQTPKAPVSEYEGGFEQPVTTRVTRQTIPDDPNDLL